MTESITSTLCPPWCERHDTHAHHSGVVATTSQGTISLMELGADTVINPPPELDLLTPSEARELAGWLAAAADMAERKVTL